MTIATEVRAALKSSLAAVPANIYDHVPEAPQVPHVSFVPDDPYLEIETIGKAIRLLPQRCPAHHHEDAAMTTQSPLWR